MMGLFDSLMKAGEAAYSSMQKNAAEVEEHMESMRYYSDEELFRALCSGSYQKRSACSLVLQERGYSSEEVAEAIRRKRHPNR